MNKEILFLNPVLLEKPWGKIVNGIKIGETLIINCNNDLSNKIKNGFFKDMELFQIYNNEVLKKLIFGKKYNKFYKFPFGIKYITSKDNLSLQVHPKKRFLNNNNYGKHEIWYNLNEIPSNIICGFNKKLKDKNINYINNKFLNYIEIKNGDLINVPGNVIHAILKNNNIIEIYQNNDITYRIFDWERIPARELHIEEAKKNLSYKKYNKNIKNYNNKNSYNKIFNNKFYKVEKIISINNKIYKSKRECCDVLLIIKGIGKIFAFNEEYDIKIQDCLIVPRKSNYYLSENIEFFRITI